MELVKHVLIIIILIELAILFSILLYGFLYLDWASQALRIIYNN